MRVVITGATAGIGEALAHEYAAAGVTLGLTGRRADRLEAVAAACRAKGATVHTWPTDVVDQPGMQAMAREFLERAGGVDLVIANAGIGGPDRLERGDPAPIVRTLEVNVNGVVNTLVPFMPAMIAQRSGHLAAVASVAGFRAMPLRTTYSASKIAVRTLMEGWGMDLEPHGITVTSINPGFVESELTAKNRFPMPFILPTPAAARRIVRALRRRRRVYTFPLPMAVLARVLALAPRWVVKRLVR